MSPCRKPLPSKNAVTSDKQKPQVLVSVFKYTPKPKWR
jgi:hypothetical protein